MKGAISSRLSVAREPRWLLTPMTPGRESSAFSVFARTSSADIPRPIMNFPVSESLSTCACIGRWRMYGTDFDAASCAVSFEYWR